MDRQSKIDILRDIAAGQAPLSILRDQQFTHQIDERGHYTFYIDGIAFPEDEWWKKCREQDIKRIKQGIHLGPCEYI